MDRTKTIKIVSFYLRSILLLKSHKWKPVIFSLSHYWTNYIKTKFGLRIISNFVLGETSNKYTLLNKYLIMLCLSRSSEIYKVPFSFCQHPLWIQTQKFLKRGRGSFLYRKCRMAIPQVFPFKSERLQK